jgi:glycosyltransferase involved in cell wall biosynthesis
VTAPVHLVVPGPLDQRTGGYIYDKRIAEGLQAQGWSVQAHELAGAFPQVDGMARAAAEAVLPALADGVAVIDGLALPAFDGLLERLPARWLALVHHPLALETGLGSAAAEALAALEGRLLHHAPRIVVTSPRTRRDLAMFALPPERIGVVLPGTAPAPRARGSGGREVGLLCVASLTPRKGHLVLLAALAGLQDLAWRLVCVGSAERDPATAAAIRAAIAAHGLAERVRLVPEQDAAGLAAYYDAADLFVLASHHEGYGMVLAEALARGLPIVATTAGAIPDTVPPLAGRLVPPGDAGALAATLRRLIANPAARTRLAEGARLVRKSLPDWPDAVRGFARELALLGGA